MLQPSTRPLRLVIVGLGVLVDPYCAWLRLSRQDLGQFAEARVGARADSPTLLDRNYLPGYAVLVLLIAGSVAVATLLRMRRADTGRAARSVVQNEGGASGGASPGR